MLKKLLLMALVLVTVTGLVFADESDAAFDGLPSTLAEKFSYAFGLYLASNYGADNAMSYFYMYKAYQWPELDEDFGYMGVYCYSRGILLFSIDEINGFLAEYPADYSARMAALAVTNLEEAEAFLAENSKKEGVHTTKSGLQYIIVEQGNGAMATATDSVELDYELTLLDGTVADSSYARGEHSTFPLSGVIEGFREGVMLMPMGSSYIFYIHPDLGYGSSGTGSIGPNALLIFKVKTYSIE